MHPDTAWRQNMIRFGEAATIDATAAHHLAPALNEAQDAGLLNTWWYINKPPGWRLRYQATDSGAAKVAALLTQLVTAGHIADWTHGIYEPETLAFGGPAAIDAAHTLFHNDSRHVLARAEARGQAPSLGRRETTVLLFSTMLHAAALDWSEQGDVWAKILNLRDAVPHHAIAPERVEQLAAAMRRLMIAAPSAVSGVLPEPWLAAFDTAGGTLAALAQRGLLERGLRAVLAHHFIFHANRARLSGADQARMATLAVQTVFHSPD